MQTLRLALDWTPNANHIGFFVARDKGFYKDYNIQLIIDNPKNDNYNITPAKKVELGLADFALCPTESLISFQTKAIPFQLVGISSIFKEDLSAISVLEKSSILSPKDLDHKLYASYKARYEDGIVKQMIKNDGGKGQFEISYPNKLGIWNTLLKGEADATWIFLNWEGIEAESKGLKLRNFKLEDYKIPYSYSPLIAASAKVYNDISRDVESFLEATKQGFYYAKKHPREAAEILSNYIPEHDIDIDLTKAIALSCDALGSIENWGELDIKQVSKFLNWLKDHHLEYSDIKAEDLLLSR